MCTHPYSHSHVSPSFAPNVACAFRSPGCSVAAARSEVAAATARQSAMEQQLDARAAALRQMAASAIAATADDASTTATADDAAAAAGAQATCTQAGGSDPGARGAQSPTFGTQVLVPAGASSAGYEGSWWATPWSWTDAASEVVVTIPLPSTCSANRPAVRIMPGGAVVAGTDASGRQHRVWEGRFAHAVNVADSTWTSDGAEVMLVLSKPIAEIGRHWQQLLCANRADAVAQSPSAGLAAAGAHSSGRDHSTPSTPVFEVRLRCSVLAGPLAACAPAGATAQPSPPAAASRPVLEATFAILPSNAAQPHGTSLQIVEPTLRGPGDGDYLGLYPVGCTDIKMGHFAVEFTDGAMNGTVRMTLPARPGKYEVWYVHAATGTVVGKSPVIRGGDDGVGQTGTPTATKAHRLRADSDGVSIGGATTEDGRAAAAGVASSLIPVDDVSVNPEEAELSAAAASAAPSALEDAKHPSLIPELLLRPPYFLEKHAQISVYQLHIPLPSHLRLPATAGAGAVPRPSPGVATLPPAWRPGVAIDSRSDGVLPATEFEGQTRVEVAFELPRLCQARATAGTKRGGAEATPSAAEAAVDSTGGAPSPTRQSPRQAVDASARDVFQLQLHLPLRIERAKCSMQLHADCISLRLPLYYGGAAVPDRPASLITSDELLALRYHGRTLGCRCCGSVIMQPQLRHLACEAGMRAFVLPSEHWLEWSDFWLCHGEQANIFIPDTDFGAERGTVLIGETHVQLHPGDLRPAAVTVRAPAQAVAAAKASLPPGSRDSGVAASVGDISGGELRTPRLFQCDVECSRCCAPLGVVSCCVPAPAAEIEGGGFRLCSSLQSTAAAPGNVPATSASDSDCAGDGWRDKLSVEADPVLRLYKDRLQLAVAMNAPPSTQRAARADTPAAGVGRVHAPPALRSVNVFARYSACSRLATQLLSEASTHQQYRFLLGPKDSGADIHGGQVRARLVLMNWNTSIRAGRAAAVTRDDGVHGCDGGHHQPLPASCAYSADEHADVRSTSAREANDALASVLSSRTDVPALKLRYEVLAGAHPDAGLSRASTGAALETWSTGDAPAQLLSLLDEECDTVIATLLASTRLLPPSCRALDGMAVGFLPFW